MGFIKEFKEFTLRGNLADIAIAFVMGGAFGKMVTTLTDGIIAPIIGLIGNADLNKNIYVLRKGKPEIKDATGKIIEPAIQEVVLKWGEFITSCINFIIIAFVMFWVIKIINRMKKKQAVIAAEPSSTDKLLTEIRDLLKK